LEDELQGEEILEEYQEKEEYLDERVEEWIDAP